MLPISQEFHVPLTAVTAVFTLTLWMRLVGATASGWLADRIGRKKPLMISIAWYSACNFIAAFSPAFWFLFLFRALLGIGMGAEWPCGAALAMENWPIRSRGFMGGVLQVLVGPRRAAVERRLRPALYIRSAGAVCLMHRRPAGAVDRLCAPLCQRAAGLGREPPAAAHPAARGPRAAAQDLQARPARQHADRVLVDGQRLCRRLLGRRAVPDLSAKGSAPQPGAGRVAGHAAEHGVLSCRVRSGAGWRTASAAAGRSSSRPADDPGRAALSDDPTITR